MEATRGRSRGLELLGLVETVDVGVDPEFRRPGLGAAMTVT